MSELDEVSVYPKPIERQRVSTCLKVFSEETIVAFEYYGKVNVDLRKRQPLQAVVSDPMDEQLNYLQEFGDMGFKMSGKQGKRNKQLSKDTAVSMHHTCYGLVDLAKHLFQEENYEYVCLGMFSTGPLGKAFSKLRLGSGGTYFINAQQVTEKLRIQKAKLQIKLNHIMVDSSVVRSHQCEDCNYHLKSDESNLLDELSSLEAFVNRETKIYLVHIAGYVSRKNPPEVDENTYDYYEMYGGYTMALDRGGLVAAGDKLCQWTIFCFIMFDHVKKNKIKK